MKKAELEKSQPMEKQILTEESMSPEELPKTKTPKTLPKVDIKNLISTIILKFKNLKRPKPIVLITLTVSIILVFVAILLLSTRQPKPQPQTTVKIVIPTPSTPKNEELDNIKKEISIFSNELISLDSQLNSIEFPKIDLDINFD